MLGKSFKKYQCNAVGNVSACTLFKKLKKDEVDPRNFVLQESRIKLKK